MRHFKSQAGEVFGFDADQPGLIANAQTQGWQELAVWPLPPTAEEIAAAENAAALADLVAIDLASVRSIREYIAAKPDAPQILKDHEAAAIAARGRLVP